MQRLKPGHVLGDHTIVRFIARGGMGEVYEAHDNKLDRKVALKVVFHDESAGHDSEDLVKRFMAEARNLAKVNHPNIVTIHAIHNSGSMQHIAMEYVDGVSLKDFLEEYSIDPVVAQIVFEQILSGVKRLHEHNIIHRDLKPANILIKPDGHIKILDFGIAKSPHGMVNTNPGKTVGTPSYMAPELRKFQPASVRSDLWSVGALFYECLTGKVLSLNLEDNELQFNKKEREFIPESMRALIACLAAHDPSDRYAKASEAMDDLQSIRTELGRPSSTALTEFHQHLSEIKKSKSVTAFEINLPPPNETVESSIRREAYLPQASTRKRTKSRSTIRRERRNAMIGIAFAMTFMVAIAGLIDHFSQPMRATPAPVSLSRRVIVPAPVPTPVPVVATPPPAPLPLPEPVPLPMQVPVPQPVAQAQPPPQPKRKVASVPKQKPVPKKKEKPKKSERKPAASSVTSLPPAPAPAPPPPPPQPPQLEPPLPRSPGIGAEAPSRNGRISVEFSWFGVTNAASYILEVARDERFKDILDRRTLPDAKALVEQARWQGRVYWRVRAVDGDGKFSKWSDVSYFNIE